MSGSVILVDEQDHSSGTITKEAAHQKPLLHRAYSILIFRPNGELILQQRALHKYHSAGLWSNTCCSHPLPGLPTGRCATSRLKEEMGIEAQLTEIGTLSYHLELADGLFESEFNHVFCGYSDASPLPNADEVAGWKTLPLNQLGIEIQNHPTQYSAWLPLILTELALPLNRFIAEPIAATA
ncbi:MAG: isopentenyl-diphosphate Delta-isomerase [Immundisolibacteraceae bacterium]|nr:isopentenyl-diphosphate Delta-isomerase [Immundisolibacteraceae bacterium]